MIPLGFQAIVPNAAAAKIGPAVFADVRSLTK
jgi:hypothetical protein